MYLVMIFNHGLSVENPKVTSRKSLTQNDLASIVVGRHTSLEFENQEQN